MSQPNIAPVLYQFMRQREALEDLNLTIMHPEKTRCQYDSCDLSSFPTCYLVAVGNCRGCEQYDRLLVSFFSTNKLTEEI